MTDDPQKPGLVEAGTHSARAKEGAVIPLVADQELLSDFIQDARDQLMEAEVHLMDLKDDLANKGAIEAVLRAVHSIKSGAAFLHLAEVHQVAHETEGLLDFAHKGDFQLSQLIVELLFRTTDMLRTLLTNVETALATDGLLHPWHQVPTLVEALRQGLMDRLLGADEDTAEAQPSPEARQVRRDTVRIHVDKFEELHKKIDQLSALAPQIANRIHDVREKDSHPGNLEVRFRSVVADLVGITREFRMMPLAGVESLLRNVLGEASHQSGKLVDLILMDGGWSLDSKAMDHLKEVFIQLAQNSMDHGVELPSEREAAGKDPRGTFLVTAFQKDEAVCLEVSDDGRGLDREALKKLGKSKGLLGDHGAVPDSQVDNLIFAPGISTAPSLTEHTGRGFGLDIAKYRVEELGGKLTVSTEPGQRTSFLIELPVEHHLEP